MARITDDLEIPDTELEFSTSRSGGPGGQNVNKVNTRVTLLFDVGRSPSLTEEQRERLRARLGGAHQQRWRSSCGVAAPSNSAGQS